MSIRYEGAVVAMEGCVFVGDSLSGLVLEFRMGSETLREAPFDVLLNFPALHICKYKITQAQAGPN
jgi:hypothetical protein